MFESLRGKTALITGASRGIGRGIALAMAEVGVNIILNYAGNEDAAHNTQEEILAKGVSCTLLKLDLSNPSIVDTIPEELTKVDILVLNASIQIRNNWKTITLEQAQTQLNCNFLSSLKLIQRIEPGMEERNWGRVLVIGSVQEKKPHPDMLIYSAIKAGLTNMVQSLALQFAPHGVTINNLAPGVIYTDRNKEVLADADYAKKVMDSIPCGFYGMPEDCAGAALLLCSDEGRYITGQSLYADGGKSL